MPSGLSCTQAACLFAAPTVQCDTPTCVGRHCGAQPHRRAAARQPIAREPARAAAGRRRGATEISFMRDVSTTSARTSSSSLRSIASVRQRPYRLCLPEDLKGINWSGEHWSSCAICMHKCCDAMRVFQYDQRMLASTIPHSSVRSPSGQRPIPASMPPSWQALCWTAATRRLPQVRHRTPSQAPSAQLMPNASRGAGLSGPPAMWALTGDVGALREAERRRIKRCAQQFSSHCMHGLVNSIRCFDACAHSALCG